MRLTHILIVPLHAVPNESGHSCWINRWRGTEHRLKRSPLSKQRAFEGREHQPGASLKPSELRNEGWGVELPNCSLVSRLCRRHEVSWDFLRVSSFVTLHMNMLHYLRFNIGHCQQVQRGMRRTIWVTITYCLLIFCQHERPASNRNVRRFCVVSVHAYMHVRDHR